MISGPAGTGKSAVIARAAGQARERFPRAIIVERFIGATPPSVDGRSLLQSLSEELGRQFQNDAPVPLEYRELVSAFRERLAWATAERPALVFLDAVDQLLMIDGKKGFLAPAIFAPEIVEEFHDKCDGFRWSNDGQGDSGLHGLPCRGGGESVWDRGEGSPMTDERRNA